MEKFWVGVGYAFAVVVGWAAGVHNALWGLLILQGVDVFTGVLYALRTHQFRSAIGKAGIQRRIATWALLIAIGTFQHYTGLLPTPDNPDGMGIVEWTAVGMAFMEFASIVENAKLLGVPIPGWLVAAVAKVNAILGLEPREPGENGK